MRLRQTWICHLGAGGDSAPLETKGIVTILGWVMSHGTIPVLAVDRCMSETKKEHAFASS
jgi:hypothetical protein